MTQVQSALLWATLMLGAAFLAMWLDLPGPSQALLITTLAGSAAISIRSKRRSRCSRNAC